MSNGHFYFFAYFLKSGFIHASLTHGQQTSKAEKPGSFLQELLVLKNYIVYVKRELYIHKQLLLSWVIIYASSNFPHQYTHSTLITNREDKIWRETEKKNQLLLKSQLSTVCSMVCTLKVRLAKLASTSCQRLQEIAIFVLILNEKVKTKEKILIR